MTFRILHIGAYCCGGDRLRATVDANKDQLRQADVDIASDESVLGPALVPGCTRLYPEARKRLQAALQERGAIDRVLLLVRSTPDLVERYYRSLRLESRVAPFSDWASDIEYQSLRWEPMVRELEEIAGDRLVVAEYALIYADPDRLFAAVGAQGLLSTEVKRGEIAAPVLSQRGKELAIAIDGSIGELKYRARLAEFVEDNYRHKQSINQALLRDKQYSQLEQIYAEELGRILRSENAFSK